MSFVVIKHEIEINQMFIFIDETQIIKILKKNIQKINTVIITKTFFFYKNFTFNMPLKKS